MNIFEKIGQTGRPSEEEILRAAREKAEAKRMLDEEERLRRSVEALAKKTITDAEVEAGLEKARRGRKSGQYGGRPLFGKEDQERQIAA